MPSLRKRRVGRGLLIAAASILLLDGLAQFASPAIVIAALIEIGFPSDAGPRIALLALGSAALLAIPRTAPIGAICATAFLGGAICAHFRLGDVASPPQLICVAIGLLVWFGLALADPRVPRLLAERDDAPDARRGRR